MDWSTPFLEIAEKLERVSSTSSKTLKVKLVSELLLTIRKEEVGPVVRMMLGRPLKGEKKDMLQVGYSILIDVILDITGARKGELHDLYIKYGDLGQVAFYLFQKKSESALFQTNLTVKEVLATLENLSRLSGKGSKEMKERYLKSLLIHAKPVEAKYIVKMLTGEMRTGMVEGLMEEAVSSAFGIEKETSKDLHMIVGDISVLAEKAANGEISTIRLKQFRPVAFMLAETAKDASDVSEHFKGDAYAEFKYDGIRAQVHKLGNEIRIYSRRLEDVTDFFPEIRERAFYSSENFILDGEIVPFKEERPLPFHLLQKRLRRISELATLIEEVPVDYFAFDILLYNEKETYKLPLRDRVNFLKMAVGKTGLRLAHQEVVKNKKEVENLFELSKRLGYEGLVIKDPDSTYVLGKRGADWLKLKKELEAIDAVIVAAEYGHGKRAGLLSDYTFAVRGDGKYLTIGKAYSGLTDEEIREMTDRLLNITVEDLGFIKRVRPEIVVEVAFDSIQKSDRYDSGFALRFPRIKRIRLDKKAEEADTIEKVKEIYMAITQDSK